MSGVEYGIMVEDENYIHYRINKITDVNLDIDFFLWQENNINYLEDFVEQIKQGDFNFYKKIWRAFDKLTVDYDHQLVAEMAKEFFDL